MNAMQQLLTEHMAIWTAADTEKKSGRGRASGNAGSVYGIKKLRELILELAVRGKLLPQDVNDEPASELLKQILAEKGKPIAKIPSSEQPYDLPNNWEWLKLGDCSGIERGGSPRPIQEYLTDDIDGLNWIKIGDTEKNSKFITSTNEKIKKEGLFKTRMVYPGDFLLTNSMSFGRPYITKIQGCIHDGWLRIHPPSMVDKDYLYNLLLSPYVYKSFTESAAGAVVQNLNAEKVRDLLIPLPPFAEQLRIAAKIDELMALCDQLEAQHSNAAEAHEKLVSHLLGTLTQSQNANDFSANWQRIATHFNTLFTTEASIDALKQTLLQLAVMGKLVPQDANDEPASELLKRIQAEKAKLVAEGKIKKEKPLALITDDEKPFVLPLGWVFVRNYALFQLRKGRIPKSLNEDELGLPYLDIDALDRNIIRRYSEELTCPQSTDKDILVVCDGSRSGLVLDGKNGIIGSTLSIIDTPVFIQNYIKLIFKQGFEIFNTSMKGAAIPHLDTQKLLQNPTALPPLEEQHRIVAKVDELMALCDQLKFRITSANQQQQKLADILVEQAVA
jgi:type I restriction enzyme S subunit